MVDVVKLRKGLNINLMGNAERRKTSLDTSGDYAVVPDDFIGVKPKMVVHEGDDVKAGDALFVNKNFPDVSFCSPVSGKIKSVVRGERRKIIAVIVSASPIQEYTDFGHFDLSSMDGKAVREALLKAGLFGYIEQLPYAISTTPDTKPKAIFVSAFRDMPLSGDFEYELKDNETDFQTGLTALSKIAETHLGIGINQTSSALANAKDVIVTSFDGPCPAGNVGVQVNHVSPVNKGDIVWTVDPTVVIFIGRLMNNGKVDLKRTVAVAGSRIKAPHYVETLIGTPLSRIIADNIYTNMHVRIINGNPLTGRKATSCDYLGAHVSEVTAIPEGDDVDELAGWAMPRLDQFSTSRCYFSWLLGRKHQYDMDARIKGGERHMIMSGEYDKVLPMDIYGEYLIKAFITKDIDRMEQLGAYEVAPADFALAEFVDSSKLELQKIVRDGLDLLRKENM